MMRRLAPTSRIVAFEPVPEVFEILRSNCVSADIDCHNLALSDVGGVIHMEVDPSATERSQISSNGQRPVDAVTLDQILDLEAPGAVIDLLKIDVERHELRVLAGATEALRRTRRVWIEVTVSGNEQYTVPELLHCFAGPSLSFQLTAVRNWSNRAEGAVPVMECLLTQALHLDGPS